MSNEGRSPDRLERAPPPARPSRRAIMAAAAAVTAGALAARFGWIAATGKRPLSQQPDPIDWHQALWAEHPGPLSPPMRLTGASMMPTLRGLHAPLRCDGCEIVWHANWQPTLRPAAEVICWNCGAAVATASATAHRGDAVQIERLRRETAPACGDLVAIVMPPPETSPRARGTDPSLRWRKRHDLPPLSVKRVVARPGQQVTHDHGRLLVDGQPIAGEPIWIPVHDDAHRRDGDSWWQPQSPAAGRAIRETESGFTFIGAPFSSGEHVVDGHSGEANGSTATTPWLIYQHRSVHNDLRADSVRDDVPANVSEVRRLLPVERLRLSLRIDADGPLKQGTACRGALAGRGTLEVAFWNGRVPVVHRFPLTARNQRRVIVGPPRVGGGLDGSEAGDGAAPDRVADAAIAGATVAPAALGETQPVAVRVIDASATISGLRIERPVVYRIGPRLAAVGRWPLVLGAQEYYVLGDNVPLSVDSRHFGPIDRDRIVGRIRPVRYDESLRSK